MIVQRNDQHNEAIEQEERDNLNNIDDYLYMWRQPVTIEEYNKIDYFLKSRIKFFKKSFQGMSTIEIIMQPRFAVYEELKYISNEFDKEFKPTNVKWNKT